MAYYVSDGTEPWPLMRTATGRRLKDNPWLTLVSVTLGVIMVGIDGSVVAVANPYIGKDLHASLADLQWVTNAYLLVIAATLILGGKLGDRFGRRRVFLIGVVGFSLTSVAIGLVGTIDGVILLRGVQGAFGALLLPNTLALLKAAFPPEELNRAVGIWVSASADGDRRRTDHRRDLRRAHLVAERLLHQPAHRSDRPRRRRSRPERDEGIGAPALRHPRACSPSPRGCWPSSTGW